MEDKTMNTNSTSLSIGDQIFATLEVGGKTVASVYKTNFATINDIVRFVGAVAGRFMGLARLHIRNKTQGWTMNLSLASLAPRATGREQSWKGAASPVSPSQYRQATLLN